MYQITIKSTQWAQNIPNGRKIDPMAIKYTNHFHCKSLQNLPKLGFLVWKYATWQPSCYWGRCYDHNFLRFLTIFGEKIGVFLKKPMLW
jgi:hypothetical protein